MIKKLNLIPLIFFLLISTSCKNIRIQDGETKNNEEKTLIDSKKTEKEKIEIRISCGKGKIEEYLKKGWVITKEYTEEKVCSWKSVRANKDCDIQEDKGRKITKTDKIGEETIYILEK